MSNPDIALEIGEHVIERPGRLVTDALEVLDVLEFLESVNIRMAGGVLAEHGSDEWLPISDRPDEIHIIVAGGPGKHSCWMPTFGGMTRPVTVRL